MVDILTGKREGWPGASGLPEGPETLGMYARVLESMVEGVSLSDEQGIICYTNPAEDRMFGYERGELIGQHVSVQNTYPPEESRRVVNEVIEHLKVRGFWSGEFSNRRKDGTPFTTSARITGIEAAGRKYWVCVQEDVTERKRAENILAVRVRQQAAVAALGQRALGGLELQALMDETAALVAETLDVEFCKILELLPEGDKLLLRAGFGWEEGTVGSAHLGAGLDSHGGYTLASDSPVIVEDLRTETRFNGPRLLLDHDVVSGISVIIFGEGTPFGVLGAHTTRHRIFTGDDINFLQSVANVLASAIARTRVEEELHSSRDQLAVILQGVADAITVQDATGKIIYVNDAAARLLGFDSQAEVLAAPASEVVGKFDLLDEKQKPLSLSELPGRYALQGEEMVSRTIGWRIRSTGELRWSVVRAAPVKNEHGEVQIAVNIIRDITEQVEMERRKDDFIALASHELKTPITSMKIFAQMLKRRFERASAAEGDGPVRELARDAARQLSRLDDQLDKLTELVRDLLDVSKIDAGKLAYSMEEVDMNLLVRETVEDLQRVADRHTIEVKGRADIHVIADRERIRQVLTNLITNAVKYSPEATRIIVAVSSKGGKPGSTAPGEVVVCVQDFGIGIPRSAQHRIFERFFQVTDSGAVGQDTYPGLGLGLYISSQIVKRHGGSISVESDPGKGSTFCFRLPAETPERKQSNDPDA